MPSPDSKFKVVAPLRQPGTKLCIKLETTKTNATGMWLSVSLVWYLESKQVMFATGFNIFLSEFHCCLDKSMKVLSHPRGHFGLHVVTKRQWDVAPGCCRCFAFELHRLIEPSWLGSSSQSPILLSLLQEKNKEGLKQKVWKFCLAHHKYKACLDPNTCFF